MKLFLIGINKIATRDFIYHHSAFCFIPPTAIISLMPISHRYDAPRRFFAPEHPAPTVPGKSLNKIRPPPSAGGPRCPTIRANPGHLNHDKRRTLGMAPMPLGVERPRKLLHRLGGTLMGDPLLTRPEDGLHQALVYGQLMIDTPAVR